MLLSLKTEGIIKRMNMWGSMLDVIYSSNYLLVRVIEVDRERYGVRKREGQRITETTERENKRRIEWLIEFLKIAQKYSIKCHDKRALTGIHILLFGGRIVK